MKILVAPLDWGLGHATRCVPLIRRYLSEGHEVVLAGNGRSGAWLRRYFPQLTFLDDTPGHEITYPHHGSIVWHLVKQYRPLLRTIEAEHQWLTGKMSQLGFDMVISDNRYGLHHPQAHCVIVTHQLFPVVPVLMRHWVHGHIVRWTGAFDEIWIPDVASETDNFSGALSHGAFPHPVKFIGPLSRFDGPAPVAPAIFDMFASVSGPEPARSVFEQALTEVARTMGLSACITGGIPSGDEPLVTKGMVQYSDVNDADYRQAIAQSRLVVCRSGYSTLMDLHALGAGALLIPTPGQSEQEYLAQHWAKKPGFSTCDQTALAPFLRQKFARQE